MNEEEDTLEGIAGQTPGTGADRRHWILEFKIALVCETGNQHIKPDVDKIFRNSSVGAAWERFIRAIHQEGATLYDTNKYGDEAPINGDTVTLLKAFDEGPAIKRLQQGLRGVP
jgi:hypothetical protein